MKLIIDIEANGLEDPTEIWLVVCKEVDTGKLHIFREVTKDADAKRDFISLIRHATQYIGHNWLGYDWPNLARLLRLTGDQALCEKVVAGSVDTLIVSKLVDYSRSSHSIEDYGLEFGFPKIKFDDFSKYSKEMEEYCIKDVEITEKIYKKYRRIIDSEEWKNSLETEHIFQYLIVNALHDNGFYFNKTKAEKLLDKVTKELAILDKEILKEFPPRLKPLKEITPRLTKHGTLNRSDFRFLKDGDLTEYNGGPFTRCHWVEFNPSSHKQIVEILNAAGWSPTDKTQTHIEALRDYNKLKYKKHKDSQLDFQFKLLHTKLVELAKTGWKVNETNLATLPSSAPSPARTLAKRILLESRRRTLVEWLSLVSSDGRVHGKYYGIGAWTHRMAHQSPNTANIPTEAKLFGKEMRQLWCAPKNRLLVGVDAEGIQLRIFAHYINDPEFTQSLVEGKKDDKSDPHSLNARILGPICNGRQTAKRFIYALLLGAGIGKLSEILGASQEETERALDRLLQRYTGFAYLKENVIPADAQRGWFLGLDGRHVSIPGETVGTKKHLCMSGYLQNGESIIMKKACVKWHKKLTEEFSDGLGIDRSLSNSSSLFHSNNSHASSSFLQEGNAARKWFIVNFVHDEWQTECENNVDTALRIAAIQADSLREVGEELKLNCPLAGSYWNEDHKDYTIGTNWYQTH